MLNAKKMILGLFILSLGNMVAQIPTITVTFKSDQSVTEPIEITFARQTQSLAPFLQSGSSVTFKSGLKFNTDYFLDALARKSGIASLPYILNIAPTNPSVTVTVSINPTLPANQQITFKNDSGRLSVRKIGL